MSNNLTVVNNANDFSGQLAIRETEHQSHGLAVDVSRAIREVEAALTVAKSRPRDELDAYKSIMTSCKRPSFAEKAVYRYRRGADNVEGPSIRLAENIARAYGNLEYGWIELERSSCKSLIVAFCWDLETNTKRKMTFEVTHVRDTKQGPKPLTSERDIYEHIANYAARRVRSCILSIIPADLIEDALSQCKSTMSQGINSSNRSDVAKKIVLAFEEIGVSHDMLKKFLDVERVVGASEAQLVELRAIYTSIKDGQATVKEFFDDSPKSEKASKSTLTSDELAKKLESDIDVKVIV